MSRPLRAVLLSLAVTLGSFSVLPAASASHEAAHSADEFVIASFNILGASHTDGRHDRGFDRSGVRLYRAIKALRRSQADIVGLQEFQLSQRNRFVARVGGAWGLHSGYSHNTDNTIAWRTDRFALVDSWTRRVPYFHGRMRKMPIVALRSRETNLVIYVMNVHNPADSKGNAERWRRKAMRIERKVTSRLTEQLHAPVFLTGDMNDREDFFCPFTGNGVMHSFLGGSNPPGASCAPPRSGIDWIFGNQYVEFSSPQIDRSWLVARTSDHPIVSAHVRLR
ncbi:endonuclease/exonuclease/phosphatase family protein [Nocardioides sp.]|uniref:endonuclease/exonuclease/phosphatase family protein n=1 Tax=Nocardioides sp. TaxID=35761 RepID=UPI002ED89AED